MTIDETTYGVLPDGQAARLWTLRHADRMVARLTDFGATLVALETPDRSGRMGDITLGYDRLDGWVADKVYMGTTVGRYGNRIGGASFTLDGRRYMLPANEGRNQLHGGFVGFHKHLWRGEPFSHGDELGVRFTRTSPDGEEGFPGNLDAVVTYRLTPSSLAIDFEATTDRPTIVNLVHHTYWNLSADPTRSVLDHRLRIAADRYLPVDAENIPTGEMRQVSNTPFDLRDAQPIGARIGETGAGYDHCWVFDRPAASSDLILAAELHEPLTGRVMRLYTDQPGMQFYAGFHLNGTITGKGGVRYGKHAGLCMETERLPDTPNKPTFASCVLRPGERYVHRMVHEFDIR